MTNAKPKIAPYPFTTIIPNLGVISVDDSGEAIVVADIPGLLEGASEGVGLGRGFLRHIERCKIIVHLLNGDNAHVVQDYVAINRELQLFSAILAKKPQIVVLNKCDLPSVQERQAAILGELQSIMPHSRLLVISAAGRIGLDDFVAKTMKFLKKIKSEE